MEEDSKQILNNQIPVCNDRVFHRMIKSNCHTHTIFCDGKNTAEEMAEAAYKLGFTSLGFSAHSPMNFENDYECPIENLNDYITTINRLKKEYSDKMEIYCGIELDEDSADVDIDLSKFDYVIVAKHQFHFESRDYYIDLSADHLSEMVNKEFSGDWLAMAKQYYSDYADFVIKTNPDVVAHFDIIQKFNDNCELFDSKSPAYKLTTLLYLEKICLNCPDAIFEVNSGAMYRCGNKKPYPAPFIMKALKKHDMKICISSDAHCTDALDYKFDELTDYCKKYGFDKVYILKAGKFEAIKI